MIVVRKGEERGHFNHGWLDTYHSFSFADYVDPNHRGFRKLRVINEDKVAPGQGFSPHSHQNMEIITYILSGAVAHEDSMGNKTKIHAGEVQRMTAGTGVTHSEFNPSPDEELHLMQIWIFPEKLNLEPSYEQRRLIEKQNELRLVAGPRPTEGAMMLHQDAELWAAKLDAGFGIEYPLGIGRHGWVQVLSGALIVNKTALKAGDGAAVSLEELIQLEGAKEGAEFLLFNLA